MVFFFKKKITGNKDLVSLGCKLVIRIPSIFIVVQIIVEKPALFIDLQASNGEMVTSEEGMVTVISDYFTALFTSESCDTHALELILEATPETDTPEMNAPLTRPFEVEEIFAALSSMGPDKSPGSDGLSAMFYERHWHIVGPTVTSALFTILNNSGDFSSINSTLVTLNPQKEECFPSE